MNVAVWGLAWGLLAALGCSEAASSGATGGGGSPDASCGAGCGGVSGKDAEAEPNLADLDLTLGGLEQDLPAPSLDCTLDQSSSPSCASWTGEYNGVRVDGQCPAGVRAAIVSAGNQRVFECDFTLSPGDALGVALGFGDASMGTPPPRAFTVSAPPTPEPSVGELGIFRDARNFATSSGNTFELAATHDFTWRVAGVSGHIPGVYPEKISEIAKGVFAAVLEPKASCVPDAGGFGCDRVRLRGTFNVKSLYDINRTPP